MYFYKSEGKQILDLSNDFILTKNENLVATRSTSAAPSAVKNANYIENVGKLTFKQKIYATSLLIKFIWSNDARA